MRGETTVTFHFDFNYSDAGELKIGNAITVRAPGLADIAVHTRLQATVAKAALFFADRNRPGGGSTDDTAEPDESEAPADPQAATIDAMQLLSMGLTPDEYTDCVLWLKKTLTGNRRLAVVAETDVPLHAEVWDALDTHGGIDAVLKPLSEFTGFFFKGPAAQKPNLASPAGSDGSASPIAAPSITRPAARIRSKS